MADESSELLLESSSTVVKDQTRSILDISQPELVFHYPDDKKNTIVERTVTLKSLIDEKLLFKIKTTAPRKYTIKPSSGNIGPKGSIDITICRASDIINEAIVDKFQVQTIILNESEYNLLDTSNREDIWKKVYRRDRITKHRITARCMIQSDLSVTSSPEVDEPVNVRHRINSTQSPSTSTASPEITRKETPQTVKATQKVEGPRKTKNYLIALIVILIVAFLSLLLLRLTF